jgi:hypothetical protein
MMHLSMATTKQAVNDWRLAMARRRESAPNSIAVSIKVVDVIADDSHRTRNIGRTVTATATASTVDITSDRNAGTRVIRVA